MAHVSDVISGWAGEVMGDKEARDWGRVVLFGNRIGEIKGLLQCQFLFLSSWGNPRIMELCNLAQLVDNIIGVRPR